MFFPWLLAVAACTPTTHSNERPTPVVDSVDVAPPWHVVHAEDGEVALRFEDSPHGARVSLGSSPRLGGPGVALVIDGRTVGNPLIAVPEAIGPAETVVITSEGYDLLVRFVARPQSELTTDPEAPEDPALTWVRIRPRNGSWRIVLDGLGEVHLPAEQVGLGRDSSIVAEGPEGQFELTTTAPAVRTAMGTRVWTLDTTPSLELREPYPRTGMTWTPAGAE